MCDVDGDGHLDKAIGNNDHERKLLNHICFSLLVLLNNHEKGASSCTLCEPGAFQNESKQASCINCNAGTYSDKTGFEVYNTCSYRLDSSIGRSILYRVFDSDFLSMLPLY